MRHEQSQEPLEPKGEIELGRLAVAPDDTGNSVEEHRHPVGLQFWLIFTALSLCIFLVALDMSIVATAVPSITAEFHVLNDAGWYGSGFFVTLASLQGFWGRCYSTVSIKWSFLASVFIFAVGSLICALAGASNVLIAGRAIAGAGASGMSSGCYTIVALVTVPAVTPTYVGLLGGVFTIASMAGPLLGGVLTEKATWRWCFYINLPICAPAMLVIWLFLTLPDLPSHSLASWKDLLYRFDLIGTAVIITSLTLYVLVLQMAGQTQPWNSGMTIGLLVVCGFLVGVFIFQQWAQRGYSFLGLKILRTRRIALSCLFIFLLNSANFLLIYTLPVYFQASQDATPSTSGIRNLPLIMGSALFSVASGRAFASFRRPQPYLFLGAAILTVGAGLTYTLQPDSTAAAYLGYQVLLGVGIGTCIQIPLLSSQQMVQMAEIPAVTTAVMFFQLLAGAMAVAAAQCLFVNVMINRVVAQVPQVSRTELLQTGASDLENTFSGDILRGVVVGYMDGLKTTWIMATAMAGSASMIGLLV